MRVELAWYEQQIAYLIGSLRRGVSKGRNKDHRGLSAMQEHNYLKMDIDAAGAEIAAAKACGVYFRGSVDAPKNEPDIGVAIQVRHTTLEHGKLIITPDADDQQFYVLVTGTLPTYKVVGHIKASKAKRDEWFHSPNNRPEAYFVPQEALTPITAKVAA